MFSIRQNSAKSVLKTRGIKPGYIYFATTELLLNSGRIRQNGGSRRGRHHLCPCHVAKLF